MHNWKTEDLVKLLSFPGVTVKTKAPGGDYDTTGLVLTSDNDPDAKVYVSGFNTEGVFPKDPDTIEIEAIEVKDGCDSSGGLRSDNLETIQIYGQVRQRLASLRVAVIDHYDQIF